MYTNKDIHGAVSLAGEAEFVVIALVQSNLEGLYTSNDDYTWSEDKYLSLMTELN